MSAQVAADLRAAAAAIDAEFFSAPVLDYTHVLVEIGRAVLRDYAYSDAALISALRAAADRAEGE